MMPLVSSDFGITISLDIGRVGKPKHSLSHPTIPWEGINELDYTLSLLFIHPLYYGREWTDWVIPCPYCSSIHCTMGGNGRTGLYFIHPLYYGRGWTDWVIPCLYHSSIHCTMGGNGRTGLYLVCIIHPSTVLREGMDGLGYTYCSSIHCTMGENGSVFGALMFSWAIWGHSG